MAIWQTSLSRLVWETLRFEALRVHRRKALSRDETAEWLNFLLNRWWVFSSPTIGSLVKSNLDPVLEESKPAFVESIEVKQFTLGDKTPYVKSVKAFDVSGGLRQPLSVFNLNRPPPGLAHSLKHQLALELEVGLDCDDFQLILRSKLGGKWMGMTLDVVIEKLNITGKMFVSLHLNMDTPYPHFSRLQIMFVDKPEVWFSIRILKTVQMMEVPILKTWLHSLVMDALTSALVDPGKLDITLQGSEGLAPVPQATSCGTSLAQGVLTVTVSVGTQGRDRLSSVMLDDVRWLVLQLGEQRKVTSQLSSRWQDAHSFLVLSAQLDKLSVKVKCKRIISSITLALFELPLSSYNFDSSRVVETVLNRKSGKVNTSNLPQLFARLEYTPLSAVQLDGSTTADVATPSKEVAGVMYACVHGADNLLAADRGSNLNPYCIIFNNRRKVKTSHYLSHTSSPRWETGVEFLVLDYTQVVLSFAVCSWDGSKAIDTDLLGICNFTLSQDDTRAVRRQIQLSSNMPTLPNGESRSFGSITVSVTFRPVASVAQSQSHPEFDIMAGIHEDEPPGGRGKKYSSSSNWMQQAKSFLTSSREAEVMSSIDIADIVSNGLGLVELSILRGKGLEARDLNGFSDPYCEVRVNQECRYRTRVKKKTLNPLWDETTITNLPKPPDTMELSVWDHDAIGKDDFLGKVTLTLDDIRQHSRDDQPTWFGLQGTKSGHVELKLKVISEDFEVSSVASSSPTETTVFLNQSSEFSEEAGGRRKSAEDGALLQSRGSVARTRKENQCSLPNGLGMVSDGTTPLVTKITITDVKQRETCSGVILEEKVDFGHLQHSPVSRGFSSSNDVSSAKASAVPADCVHNQVVSSDKHNNTARDGQKNCKQSQAALVQKQCSVPEELSRCLPESNRSTFEQNRSATLDLQTRSELSQNESKPRRRSSPQPFQTEEGFVGRKKSTEYKSFRAIREKVKRGFSHPLRRFRSDSSMADNNDHITDDLDHDSHNDVTDGGDLTLTHDPDGLLYGLEGKISQVKGLKVPQVSQLYCRVKVILPTTGRSSKPKSGKTLAKSPLLVAVQDPQFNLDFHYHNSDGISRQASLLFEIKSAAKEMLASRKILLQEVFADSSSPVADVRTWITLSSGASMQLDVRSGSCPVKLARGRSVFRNFTGRS